MINPNEIEIALCDGHGDHGVTPGKRTPLFPDGSVMYENSFNKVVVKYLDQELRRHGFRTYMVAPTDADAPLSTRTRLANTRNVDLYVSVHANAAGGVWGKAEGVETFVLPKGESKRIGTLIHKHLSEGTQQKDRGVKDGSHLWVIRKTNMPAVLLECAFMDNMREAKLLLSDSFRRECATEICKGICEAYGVKYKDLNENKSEQPKPATKQDIIEEVKQVMRDINVVSSWAKKEWDEAKLNGYFDGTRPGDNITREETAVVMNRVRRNLKDVMAELDERLVKLEKMIQEIK
ncbi:N-acetylmuramoyl-L-alanine amidase [Fictibacillus nanhaiensis]|uniref:N-acetylmuramoyl-L-alanine amidase family protein n=1 Tax=Fictibacillus nanhaiensis TaxID=742169 RepID=UPI002E23B2AB|nr:N-acetylmuramoyl-L-alanine amidase [Fictibacillus nanhaiensis]